MRKNFPDAQKLSGLQFGKMLPDLDDDDDWSGNMLPDRDDDDGGVR